MIKDNDLVLLILNNNIKDVYKQRHYHVWVRVKFIDNDGSITCKVERVENGFNIHKLNDIVTYHVDDVKTIFDENDGLQWCYSDDVTRCSCSGLCRNK